jgi:general L-amino acid transport system permease protein
MPSFAIWLAFFILAIIQAQVLWLILGKREERTGKSSNRGWWAVISFLVIVLVGWFVSGRAAGTQGMMVPRAARAQSIEDLAAMVENRLPVELAEVEGALESGELTQEELDEASLKLCTVENDPSEVNLTAQLLRAAIPYDIDRSDRIDQATTVYAEGGCEVLVSNRAALGAERSTLENGANQVIVPVAETPIRLSIPRIEGLNYVGGIKMTPSFAALLIGLVLFTGAYIAEIVRAGIQSVSKGQSEAAYALGLNESQRLRLVVLPQALRVIIPPLTSQYLNLAKNSSLAIAVGFADLFAVAFVTLNQTGRSIHVFIIIMAAYLTISLSISALLNWYNKRITLVER